ncbi:MAG: alpha/beta hydrolase [Myxococcota bacterium]
MKRLAILLVLLVGCSDDGRAAESPDGAVVDAAADATVDTSPDAPNVPDASLDDAASCTTAPQVRMNVPYAEVEGVPPTLLSLDAYPLANCAPKPIVVYVHGGGWRRGDKGNSIRPKVALFNEAGYVFVSVNYRLSPLELPADGVLDPNRVMYPIHNQDVATAIAFLHERAADIGGDPSKIAIIGFSAGAGIVSSVATDESFLQGVGLDLSNLNCTVSLDTEGYDVRSQAEMMVPIYINAFGEDPEVWDQASPINHVDPGKGIPDFLILTRGSARRVALSMQFANDLQAAGVPAEVVVTQSLDHEGVNAALGDPADTLVTPPVMRFLDGCFADAL